MNIFKQFAEYLYIKKRENNEPKSDWLRYMHGINRISIFMFILCIIFLLFKLFIKPKL